MTYLARLCACLLLVCAFVRFSAAESFKSARILATAHTVDLLQAADLNGDGRQDIVYLSSSSTEGPHVLLSNGDGTFGADTIIPVPPGNSYRTLAIADINKDGRKDLLLVGQNAFTSTIVVLLGNGDGTFQPAVTSVGPSGTLVYPEFSAPLGVADFNGDGNLDFVVSDLQNNLLSILLGDGTGHFTLKSTWHDNYNPADIHVADLNKDGKMDFVAHGLLGAEAVVYMGNGDGTFQPGVAYTGPNYIGSIVLKDMNNDGVLDMVVSTHDNAIAILLGNGDGTFSNTSAGGKSLGSLGGAVVDVEDLNGDGILDIVAATNNGICIALGKGSLSYSTFAEFPVGPFPYSATYADINGDGKTDFIVAVGGGVVAPAEGIGLLFGNGDGTLQSADSYDVGHQVTSVALGDVNGDGIPDIAVGVSDATPRILLGKADGTFTVTPDTSQPTSTLNSPSNSLIGDFNGDGKLDLFTSHYQAYLQLGNGDGTFAAPTIVAAAGTNLENAFAADFNKDGLTDVAFSAYQSVGFLTTLPGLQFQSSTTFWSYSPGNIVFGDVNHDGKLDAVTMARGGGNVAVMLGNGDGTFSLAHTYSIAYAESVSLALADLDGDGNLDIVLPTNPGINQVQLLFGNGDGTFQNPVSYPTPHSVVTVAVGDLNQDGKPDLILSDTNIVTIMHGIGNRSFDSGTDYLAGDGPSYPIVADLNGDGAPDLAFANYDVNNVSTATVLLNRGGTHATVSFTPSRALPGQPILISCTFMASVPGSETPTGRVSFSIDGGPTQNVALTNQAANLILTQPFAAGTHVVSVAYSGDSNFNPHTVSGQFMVTDYAVTLNPAALTVVAGQTGAVSVTISSSSGFSGILDLSCVGLPTGSSCSFASSTLLLQNSPAAATTLTINTPAMGVTPLNGPRPIPPALREPTATSVALVFFSAALLVSWVTGVFGRQRKYRLFYTVLVYALASVLVSCGGGGNSSVGSGSKPTSASYAVQVQAAVQGSSPSFAHSANLNLTIQSQ